MCLNGAQLQFTISSCYYLIIFIKISEILNWFSHSSQMLKHDNCNNLNIRPELSDDAEKMSKFETMYQLYKSWARGSVQVFCYDFRISSQESWENHGIIITLMDADPSGRGLLWPIVVFVERKRSAYREKATEQRLEKRLSLNNDPLYCTVQFLI